MQKGIQHPLVFKAATAILWAGEHIVTHLNFFNRFQSFFGMHLRPFGETAPGLRGAANTVIHLLTGQDECRVGAGRARILYQRGVRCFLNVAKFG